VIFDHRNLTLDLPARQHQVMRNERKEAAMEEQQRPGAGPETTGIDEHDEQLRLFTEQHPDGDASVEAMAQSFAVGDMHRLHVLGHRPDRRQTTGHYGVRGDRLEGACPRRDDVERWAPRPQSPGGGFDGHS
jgi:hypothetical protein